MQARPCEVGGKAVLILLMHHDHQFPSAQVEDAWSFFKLLDRDGGGSEPRLICFTEYVVQTKLRAMAQGAVLQAADIRNPDAVASQLPCNIPSRNPSLLLSHEMQTLECLARSAWYFKSFKLRLE